MARRLSGRDLDVMARTVWAEARGEGVEGMVAVAYVLLRRLALRKWGDSLVRVCTAPKQFSAWNDKDPNRPALLSIGWDDPSFRLAMFACIAAIHGLHPDPTGQADHYHTEAVSPYWSRGAMPVAKVGRHLFFRLHGDDR